MTSKETFLERVAYLTDRNHHTEARHYVADHYAVHLAKPYEALLELHKFFGHMTTSLGQIRTELDRQLAKHLKQKLSQKDFDEINKRL